MKKLFLLAIVALSLALPAFTQQMPPGRWWKRPEVARELGLTPQQQDKLDLVFRDATSELIDLKANVDKLSLALRSELDRVQLNRAEIQAISVRLNDARGRMFSRELMMLVDMRAALSDVQWARMRAKMEARQEREREMGPGGQRRPGEGPANRPRPGNRP